MPSASEKLRALDGTMTPGPWPTRWTDDEGDPVEFHRDLPHYWGYYLRGSDQEDLTALRNALPLIADEVGAAEALIEHVRMGGACDTSTEGFVLLVRAVAALREHLEGQ